MIKTFIISLALLGSMATTALSAQEHTTEDRIRVTGQGHVDAVPDLATLRASITAVAPTVEEAKERVDQRYEAAATALDDVGIPDNDIDGVTVRVQKEYEWSNNKRLYKGERMTRILNIKVRDIALYGEVLESLVGAGISAVDQTTMGFSDENAARQIALGMAADNARSNAEFLADRLGRRLGKVIMITDQSGPGSGPVAMQPRMMMAAEAAGDQAQPRELVGTRRVNAALVVEFELN